MARQTRISTIRHAYTHYNAQRRYAGTLDVPLSKAGLREARSAAAKLARARFDAVITSPLKRALETARILSRGNTPIVQTPLCSERRFGILEGLTWDEVREVKPPVLLIQVGYDLHTVNPKGGEALEDVWERAKEFRRFLFINYSGREVLVVSHGVFLQLFNGLLRGLNCIESLALFPGNLELARFRFAGEKLTGESVVRLGRGEVVSW
ncbi:MAG TPA: histidine phosphatase family protein [Verrucomicrobiae bacterium]|nr:histidine phosphatase family protein [Verrucomicrobiae bacterium]